MSKRASKAGLEVSDVFRAMSELEKDYPVRIVIRIEVDRMTLSGRFGVASIMAYPAEVGAGARPRAKYEVPLPNASTTSTDGLLLRGVIALSQLLADVYGLPNE